MSDETTVGFPDEEVRIWYPSPLGTRLEESVRVPSVGGAATPLTARIGDTETSQRFVTVHEAALSHSELRFEGASDGRLRASLGEPSEVSGIYTSPWRVFLTANSLDGLLENEVVRNLNEPCRITDSSWIEPGIATWDWRARGATVDGFTYGLDMPSLRRLVDHAASNGFSYTLVDAGWYGDESDPTADPTVPVQSIDISSLSTYADKQGVGLLLYVNDLALRENDVEAIFETYSRWGVAGVKHGFLGGSGNGNVRRLRGFLEVAADHELLYNVHEAFKPTGLRRTYPHLMTREFVQSLADGQPETYAKPSYHVALPFVNMLGGPLDATPGLVDLSDATERDAIGGPVLSTVCAQLARCLTIDTGLLHLPDIPEVYRSEPAIEAFLQRISPLHWDERRVLDAAFGSHVVVARRCGQSWYVGGLASDGGVTLELALGFLGDSQYTARTLSDAVGSTYRSNRESYVVSESTVEAGDTFTVEMAPGGGFVTTFDPA